LFVFYLDECSSLKQLEELCSQGQMIRLGTSLKQLGELCSQDPKCSDFTSLSVYPDENYMFRLLYE
jgi:hypothetical protein